MISNGDRILIIRRPDDDDELPGIWGLPAGSFRTGESVGDLIGRIGEEKLGVTLVAREKLAEGVQVRASYRLEMELWDAEMRGVPKHPEWRWGEIGELKPGAGSGSLCCELAIKRKGRVSG